MIELLLWFSHVMYWWCVTYISVDSSPIALVLCQVHWRRIVSLKWHQEHQVWWRNDQDSSNISDKVNVYTVLLIFQSFLNQNAWSWTCFEAIMEGILPVHKDRFETGLNRSFFGLNGFLFSLRPRPVILKLGETETEVQSQPPVSFSVQSGPVLVY